MNVDVGVGVSLACVGVSLACVCVNMDVGVG